VGTPQRSLRPSQCYRDNSETFYRDLELYGGKLQQSDFRVFLQEEPDRLSQDCREDLRKSPFFVSFESTQRCSVWVQSEEGKGRIDSTNIIVAEAAPVAPKLCTFVQTRASEMAPAVRYLFLGADRVYSLVPFIIQNGECF
jgi:hypothetical protein